MERILKMEQPKSAWGLKKNKINKKTHMREKKRITQKKYQKDPKL